MSYDGNYNRGKDLVDSASGSLMYVACLLGIYKAVMIVISCYPAFILGTLFYYKYEKSVTHIYLLSLVVSIIFCFIISGFYSNYILRSSKKSLLCLCLLYGLTFFPAVQYVKYICCYQGGIGFDSGKKFTEADLNKYFVEYSRKDLPLLNNDFDVWYKASSDVVKDIKSGKVVQLTDEEKYRIYLSMGCPAWRVSGKNAKVLSKDSVDYDIEYDKMLEEYHSEDSLREADLKLVVACPTPVLSKADEDRLSEDLKTGKLKVLTTEQQTERKAKAYDMSRAFAGYHTLNADFIGFKFNGFKDCLYYFFSVIGAWLFFAILKEWMISDGTIRRV
jgi:hypothetical protein